MNVNDLIEILMNYDVIKVEYLDQIRAKPGEIITGHCDHQLGKILVSKDCSLTTQREALVHELCHAYFHLKGKPDTERKVSRKEKALMKKLCENSSK